MQLKLETKNASYIHGRVCIAHAIWVKVFKNAPSKISGRQPLKNLK